MTYVNGTRAVDNEKVGLAPLLQMSQQESGASRAAAVSYGLMTGSRTNQAVPPDGALHHRIFGKTVDPFTENTAALIRTGELTVADPAHRSELSVRQFHRRCLTSFGLAPSTLLRINRLHQAAASVRRDGNTGLSGLAVSTGYFDQAHLCREVRQLVGDPVSKAFAVASNVRFVQYPR